MFKKCLKHSKTFSLVFLSSKRGKVIDKFQGRLVGFCFLFFAFSVVANGSYSGSEQFWRLLYTSKIGNFGSLHVSEKLSAFL